MNNRNVKIIYNLFFVITAILPVSCFKSLTSTNVVYENNFNGNTLNMLEIFGWDNNNFGPVKDQKIVNYNGEILVGKLNNNLVQLQLMNLPSHQALRVEFDLYLHNKWKNDLWHMSVDGQDKLITGFSNDSSIQQSYPNWLGNAALLGPAGKDAEDIHLPGTCSFVNASRGTSRYRIVTTVAHNNASFLLNCNDAGGAFNDTCQRSWSMDNLKVSLFKN
jgi:hypothetical protein